MISSGNDTVDDLATFTIFNNLPAELRAKTLKIACHEPRVVEVRFAKAYRTLKHDFVADIPALLHVSQEVRAEALKYYKLSLANPKSMNDVYINFDADMLYLRFTTNSDQVKAFVEVLHCKDEIQRLAFANDGYGIKEYLLQVCTSPFPLIPFRTKPAIFKFPGLKEICVVKPLTDTLDLCPRQHCYTALLRHNRALFVHEQQIQKHFAHLLNRTGVTADLGDEQRTIAEFLLGLQSHKWGPVEWKELTFTYRGVIHSSITDENLHCLPYGPNRHKTRGRKRL
jgi:hypothetical protein